MINSRRHTTQAAFWLTLLALVATACGSDGTSEPGAVDPAEPGEPRPAAVSERDIEEARSAFNSGKADWDNSGVANYTLEVSVQSIGLVRVDVVNGEAVSEEIEGVEVDEWFNDPLPRTVDAVFAELDAEISVFENDPDKVPSNGECGYHLNVRFDDELGYPSYYDTLGPCDDGVGLTVNVIQAPS